MGNFTDDADDKRVRHELEVGLCEWYCAMTAALKAFGELARIHYAMIDKVRLVIATNPRLKIETLTFAVEILRTIQKGELPHGIGDRARGP